MRLTRLWLRLIECDFIFKWSHVSSNHIEVVLNISVMSFELRLCYADTICVIFKLDSSCPIFTPKSYIRQSCLYNH